MQKKEKDSTWSYLHLATWLLLNLIDLFTSTANNCRQKQKKLLMGHNHSSGIYVCLLSQRGITVASICAKKKALTESHHAVWNTVLFCGRGRPGIIGKQGWQKGLRGNTSHNFVNALDPILQHNTQSTENSHLWCARAASCAPIAEIGQQQRERREWENRARERIWITDVLWDQNGTREEQRKHVQARVKGQTTETGIPLHLV